MSLRSDHPHPLGHIGKSEPRLTSEWHQPPTPSAVPGKENTSRLNEGSCADMKEYWRQFCLDTPIHGVKYLVSTDRPLYERLWWAGAMLTCLYFAGIYSQQLWERLTEIPDTFTPQTVTTHRSIVDIPFPAITVCDNIKSTDYNFSKEVTFLCGEDVGAGFKEDMKKDALFKAAPEFRVESCEVEHLSDEPRETLCEKMFTRVITQHGVCYTFNMLDTEEVFREGVDNYLSPHGRTSDWDPETGYREDTPAAEPNGSSDPLVLGPYPKRATGWNLFITFRPATEGILCEESKLGIKLAVHSPLDMPKLGHLDNYWIPMQKEALKEGDFMDLGIGNEFYLDVDPQHSWMPLSMKSVPLDERECYFPGEKTLFFFRHYSESNCQNECLVNYTLLECGCLDFYMPRVNGTPDCLMDEMDCITNRLEWWKRRGKGVCLCYPTCNHLTYPPEIFQRRPSRYSNQENDTIELSMYINDKTFISKEQKRLYPPYFIVDFVANCGGVFGLFCGLSILTLVELAYFGTIRLVTDLVRKRKSRTDGGSGRRSPLWQDYGRQTLLN